MTLTEKLIIPLIDDNIKCEYISDEYSFVGCYTSDKNNPSEVGHVFLLYEFYKGISLYGIYSNLKNFHSSRCIFINEKAYYLYSFIAVSKELRNITRGIMPYEEKAVKRVLTFWIDDEEITNAILINNISFSFEDREVPEEDYRIPNQFTISGYKERLTLITEGQP